MYEYDPYFQNILVIATKMKHCPEKVTDNDVKDVITAVYNFSNTLDQCIDTIMLLTKQLEIKSEIAQHGNVIKKFNEDLLELINRG